MQLGSTIKFQDGRVLTGVFNSRKKSYQAQEILTDFGYPKDAIGVFKSRELPNKLKIYGKRTYMNFMKIRGAGLVLLGFCLALGSFFAWLLPSVNSGLMEIWLFIAFWMNLSLVGILICGLIGALVVKSFSALESIKCGNDINAKDTDESVIITISPNSFVDANDIAQEWERIGGEVI